MSDLTISSRTALATQVSSFHNLLPTLTTLSTGHESGSFSALLPLPLPPLSKDTVLFRSLHLSRPTWRPSTAHSQKPFNSPVSPFLSSASPTSSGFLFLLLSAAEVYTSPATSSVLLPPSGEQRLQLTAVSWVLACMLHHNQ